MRSDDKKNGKICKDSVHYTGNRNRNRFNSTLTESANKHYNRTHMTHQQ